MPRSVTPASPPEPPPLPTHAGRYVLSEAGDAWDRTDADAVPVEGVEQEPAPLALPPAAVLPADPAPEPEA